MKIGYTADIKDGIDFKTYAMNGKAAWNQGTYYAPLFQK
ncbi:MAG: hypothetical protein UT21_C0010G0011 [Candidatus Woesebacteria bacterium GW2011_GWA1_39_11b]|nr:MAG: hypothetical protein UT21_C0010G0011 [Candidatus Woesebacteria bacterium GW2011_GWA1_39_11b]